MCYGIKLIIRAIWSHIDTHRNFGTDFGLTLTNSNDDFDYSCIFILSEENVLNYSNSSTMTAKGIRSGKNP